MDYPLITLTFAIVLDLPANILKILGIVYNLMPLHVASAWIENTVSYLMIFVILLIGHGWSISYMDIEKRGDIFLPVLIAFAIFGVLIQGLASLFDDDKDKFHAFYKGFGMVALSFRVVFLIYFWSGIKELKNQS